MKTIFTTLAIRTSVILFAQQSPPSVEWTQNYNINNTSAYNVALDNNNNVIFITEDIKFNSGTGETIKNNHLVKIGSGGVMSDVILSAPTESYYPHRLIATSDNGVITSNENDGSLQKYSSTGALVWNKTFGNDFFTDDFVKTNDNNLMVIGANFEDNDFYYMFRKMDNNGNTIWEKKAEKLNGMYYEPTAILQNSDGTYIVAGVYTDDLVSDYMLGTNLIKLEANGNLLWEKRVANLSNADVWPQQIVSHFDGGYIVLFEYDDDGGNLFTSQYTKYDSTGNVWYGTKTADNISSIQSGLDDGIILAAIGYNNDPSSNSFFLRKYDNDNMMVWENNFGNLGYFPTKSLIKVNSGYIALSNFFNEDEQANAVKITKFGIPIAATSDIAKQSITLYPNPTVDFLNLKIDNVKSIEQIDIYDASGRLVKSILDSGTTNINVKDLKKGSYIVKVKAGDLHLVSKFIKN